VPKKTSFALWPVLALLLVTAAVLVGAYTLLLSFAERTAAQSIQDGLGLENKPGVELESASPAKLLAGEFSGGHISIEDTQFGGVRAERATIDLDSFDLSVLDSASSGVLRSEEPLSGTLLVDIPEEEVGRLARVGADVQVRGVDLHRDRMLVRSAAPLLGVEVPVSIRGTLHLRGEELVFEPQRVEALGSTLPEGLAEQALAGTDFAYPLGGLPYGAKISEVEVQEGSLILSGEVERIPLGSSGS
jgi:LmeA-like phospholipid-binding